MQNVHAICRNEKILNDIDGNLYFRKTRESVRDDITNLAEITLPIRQSDTGNLEETLLMKATAQSHAH